MKKNILIVAGEASGDLHASSLVKAIKVLDPEISFFGLGGKRLRQEGVELTYDIVELAVVGIFEVLKNLQKFQKILKDLLREVDRRKPDAAILVDYPGFNLHLAKELKKRNIPVIYYISPQIWAWGGKRINAIKETIALMLVVFKFEEELYKRAGVPVAFTGHPLLDSVKADIPKKEFLSRQKLNPSSPTFALLPGSREREVTRLLPVMLQTAELIRRSLPTSQFLLLRSSTVEKEIFDKIIAANRIAVTLLTDMTPNGLAASDFAMVCSGTATLETALLGVPMAILYKVSFMTWLYMKMLIKIPYIGLVNVVRGKKFIAEFIQFDAQPGKIASHILDSAGDKRTLEEIKKEYTSLVSLLGEKGASAKAANIIVDFLGKRV